MSKELINKRGGLRGVITQILPRLSSEIENNDVQSLKTSVTELELFSSRIKALDDQIIELISGDTDAVSKEYIDQYAYHRTYSEKLLRAQELLESKPAPVNPVTEGNFRLSKLDIPKFDGSILEFQSWWDQYEIAVHTNNRLSAVEKFVYLRSLTTNDASLSIEGFPLTAANYEEAVGLLKDRYGKKSKLISAHVSKLLSLEEISGVNPKALRKQFDVMESQVRSLSALGVASMMYGCILLPILLSKIPAVIRLAWNRTDESKADIPEVQHFLTFLKAEIVAREEAGVAYISTSTKKQDVTPRHKRTEPGYDRGKSREVSTVSAFNVAPRSRMCLFCEGEHWTSQCSACEGLTKQERWSKVRDARACFLCLSPGHGSKDCRIVSKVKICKRCPSRHNVLLCDRDSASTNQSTVIVPANSSALQSSQVVVYQTVVVDVKGDHGVCRARVLFDSGAGRSFIKTSLSRRLHCRRLGNETLELGTFGGGQTRLKDARVVQVFLRPIGGDQEIGVSLLESDSLCSPIPIADATDFQLKLDSFGITISDRPGMAEDSAIQVVIGLDLLPSLFLPVSRRINCGLFAHKTKLGWTLWGNRTINSRVSGSSSNFASVLFVGSDPVEDNDLVMKSLWDLEGVGIRSEEVKVSEHPLLTRFREEVSLVDGRYEVSLPWMSGRVLHCSNFRASERRYLHLEKKLKNDPMLCEGYREVFRSYVTENIVEVVPENELLLENSADTRIFYLPHRPVVKETSSSSKVRPVFDGSARNSESVSLNDCLETGPSLIPDLVSVLLRFRQWVIGITADITKAFLQVGVRESDRNVLRFLMRIDDSGDIQHYRFRRVPFGLCCSPFLLNATIKVHLEEEGSVVALKALRDFYVDDLVSGVDSLDEVNEFISSLASVFGRAGMSLTKWRSTVDLSTHSDGSLRSKMGKDLCPTATDAKVLGLTWCQDSDSLSLQFDQPSSVVLNTKRRILKILAHVFDPIGLVAPFVVVIKIIFQKLWVLSLGWDDLIPDFLEREATSWYSDFLRLKMQVPRKYFDVGVLELVASGCLQIHVFCDASLKAYGSVIFFRAVFPDGSVGLSFVMAKSRVAPLKSVTLPRLELLAALVGSRLCAYVRKSIIGLDSAPCYFWSDSQIVLCWINSHPSRFKIFVSNRVSEIQSLSSPTDWRFCRSECNSADVLSRGCSLDSLEENFWTAGPRWLLCPESKWNCGDGRSDFSSFSDHQESVSEMKVHMGSIQVCDLSWWSKFKIRHSRFSKLVRVVAWVFRFRDNPRLSNVRKSEDLQLDEVVSAREYCLHLSQMECFPDEYSLLRQGTSLPKDSALWHLNPRFDSARQLLCVSTRLDFSEEAPEFIFPVILSHRCWMTKLIILDIHVRLGHAGVQFTLMELRSKFWCLKGRRTVRSVIQKCAMCRKFVAKSFSQPPAPLPSDRVVVSRPFTVTGVDYAGPLYIVGRKKVYLCLFTCATTRAVHLELCDSLSASDFLMAFTRFVARRGQPKKVYSDNGSHFRCGDRLLQEEFDRFSRQKVHEFSVVKGFEWIFIPPASPWWGGFWERLVGLVKRLLVRIAGKSLLSSTELLTILCSCEAIINRRPLTYLYDHPDCILPLSPNHFLLPESGNEPDIVTLDAPFSGDDFRRRLRLKESLLSSFLSRWSREYLGELRNFHRERSSFQPQTGQIVLVECEGKRHNWPLGVIDTVLPGKDGVVRVAKVRTNSGYMTRPVEKLYLLEASDSPIPEDIQSTNVADPELEEKCEDQPDVVSSPLRIPKTQFTRVGRKVRVPSRLDL